MNLFNNEHHIVEKLQEKIREYKIHFSIAISLIFVSLSAFSYYKNQIIEKKILAEIESYQKDLQHSGNELTYGKLKCSGFLTTNCEIDKIQLNVLGENSISIDQLIVKDVEDIAKFKDFKNEVPTSFNVNIAANGVEFPKTILNEILYANIAAPFVDETSSNLKKINFLINADVHGKLSNISSLNVKEFKIENDVMPISISFDFEHVVHQDPNSLIIKSFDIEMENKSIGNVVNNSMERFIKTLSPLESEALIHELSLNPKDLSEPSKMSQVILVAIASKIEKESQRQNGLIEREFLHHFASMLMRKDNRLKMRCENKKGLTSLELEKLLDKASRMDRDQAYLMMSEQFGITIESQEK